MASCQSVTSKLIKVAGDFLDQYQEFRKQAAKVYVDTIIPGKSGAEKELVKLIDAAFDLQTDLLKSYGKISNDSSWEIGARELLIPTKKATGTLIATERTFTVAPSPFDKVIVTIKKTDGKAGAEIAVCAKYASGEQFNKKEKEIEKGNDSVGQEARFVLSDMAEKFTTIHLVHKGFPTDKFSYTVEIEGEFVEDEMKDLASKGVRAH
jgi:hypothetical protein